MLGAMKLLIHHRSFYDWKLVPKSDVKSGDVALPSHHGPDFAHLQVHYIEPNTTEVAVNEADLIQSHADHQEGVALAHRGYKTKHVGHGGGFQHGQERTVEPRHLPLLSRNEFLAKHLMDAVFPYHFPSEAVTKIEVLDSGLDPDDTKRLEKFLNRRFVTDEEDMAEPPKKKAKK
jgi:hypothetical protein